MSSALRWTLMAALLGTLAAGCTSDTLTGTPNPPPPPPPPPTAPDTAIKTLEIVLPASPVTVGTSGLLSFVARNKAGDSLTHVTVTWYSSDPTIATVSKTGVVTGVHAGTVTIIADAGSVERTITATIAPAVPGGSTQTGSTPTGVGHLTVNGSVALVVGQSTTYTATLYDAQNRVVAGAPITWTSSNPAVAAVLPNGVVQALSTGSITISATSVGLTSFLALTVSAPAASSLSLDYSQDLVTGFWNYSADLALGDTYLIGARLYGPQNQRLTSLAGLTWQSDRPDIASVGPDGLVTAAATGVAVITARYGALTRDFTIRVGAFGSGNAVIRLMHGTGEAGPITFQARNGPLATLNFGESTELTVPAKSIQMVLSGVSGNPIYSAAPFDAFNGYLAPAQHYTIFSGGTTTYTPTILALLDHHDPVAADQSLIRLVMVGSYAANYYGNNIYFVDPGASIAGGGLVACYFDAPTAIGYYTRPPVPFDIVIADAGFFSAATSITTPDVEAARFQVTPVAGRATTYVITGSSRATLRITALVDP